MSSLSTLPKGDSAWLLRKSIQRIIQQVSVLETNIGSSTTGNSSNTQIIFNDAGTLRGDSGLTYNKTTDVLSVGAATITGDLTVDTSTLYVSSSADKVAIGTTSLSNEKLTVAGNISANAWLGRSNIAAPAGDCSIFRSADNTLGFGIASSTAMTLNATGLGVGGSPASKLTVSDAAAYPIRVVATAGTTAGIEFQDPTTGATRPNIASRGAALTIETGGSERLRIDTSGNLGIGVTPKSWLSSYKAIQLGYSTSLSSTTGTDFAGLSSNAYVDSVDSRWERIVSGYATQYYQNAGDGQHIWRIAGTAAADTAITWTNAMTLDASGNLLVRCTTAGSEQLGVQVIGYTNGNYVRINHNASAASGDSYLNFFYNATQIGSVTQSGTTGVAFNATSDYRLKESVQPITGALSRISSLKPSIYKWKADGSNGEGFLAHELAEVVPLAVTGEKDAVNDDGSIKPQQVDLSKVVPVLVAAIQELTARVQTLETR